MPHQSPTPSDPWLAVRDKTTGGIYWWNPDRDLVTAVGDPKPTSVQPTLPTVPSSAPAPPPSLPFSSPFSSDTRVPLGQALQHNLALGLGVGAAFALIGVLFR